MGLDDSIATCSLNDDSKVKAASSFGGEGAGYYHPNTRPPSPLPEQRESDMRHGNFY